MAYVAFVDILGFSETVSQKGPDEISCFLDSFISCAEDVRRCYQDAVSIFSVSDSLIVFANETAVDSVQKFYGYLRALFREEFIKNGILLRGGISKGEFLLRPHLNEPNNNLHVLGGRAYMEAYKLESRYKASCLVIGAEVLRDIEEAEDCFNVAKMGPDEKWGAVFPIDSDFLKSEGVMRRFIQRALESGWIPYYYNTLANSLSGQATSRQGTELIDTIVSELKNGTGDQTWRRVDAFIANAFADDVDAQFKRRILRYIRLHLT